MKLLLVVVAVAAVALAPAPDALDRAIRAEMAREHVPGLTFAVVRHGYIVRTGAYGYANLEWHAPTTVDTKFEIASISKMFVGAAVRQLVEAGSLDVEDPVSKYLGPLPDAWRGMKVRHLLTMSSGLPEDWASPLIPYDQDVTTPYDDASMLKAFFTLKMPARVGERNIYSSPGYAMLGMIVSKISGTPLTDYVREHVFAPAGMRDTSYIVNAAIVPRRADGYLRAKDGTLRKGCATSCSTPAPSRLRAVTRCRPAVSRCMATRSWVTRHSGRRWTGTTTTSRSTGMRRARSRT